MDDERGRLRDPGSTGPTADDAIIIDPIPERGIPVDRVEVGEVGDPGTEFGGGRVGSDADFDRIVDGSVGQAGAGTDELPTPDPAMPGGYVAHPPDAVDATRGRSDPAGLHEPGAGPGGFASDEAGAREAAGGAVGAVGGALVGGVVAGPAGALIGGVVGAVGGAVVGGASAGSDNEEERNDDAPAGAGHDDTPIP